MSESSVRINDKSVRLGQPVEVPETGIVGRGSEMNRVMAAWLGGPSDLPLSPLLVGPPGVGKNRIVYACSRLCASSLYIFQGHEDVTAEDFVCTARISDDRERQVDYIFSPLVSAMITGGTCFIDEIGKIRARALSPLASLLDERRYLDSGLLGERIQAHPAFRLVAATNASDLEQSALPDFLRSRLRPMITVGLPTRKEVAEILSSYFGRRGSAVDTDLLDTFWDLWRGRHGDRPASPRDALQIFAYAQKLADFDAARDSIPVRLSGANGGAAMKANHLVQAFEVFHEGKAEALS